MNISTLMPFLEENKKDFKIHCGIGTKNLNEPLEVFMSGGFKEWQEHQTQKNFQRKYILSLVYFAKDEWLFVGIYESLSVKECDDKRGGYLYNTRLTNIGKEYIGKTIIKFEKNFRASYLCLENYIDIMEVLEIRRDVLKPTFPGYDKVNVTWNELNMWINTESWKTALENMKGVYLITDLHNGKRYVGATYGDDMIWGRWSDYVKTGHGGNVELKMLDFNYIKENFTYTLLETFKGSTEKSVIEERETWWKKVLLSRDKKFGYNKN